jgi:cation diffusion facilitator CzcD-associated flavoprotein CzcO
MASLPETTDVLICGCGPAGLTAALSLRHHDPNLKITLVEARSGGTTESRALVIHAATLDVRKLSSDYVQMYRNNFAFTLGLGRYWLR